MPNFYGLILTLFRFSFKFTVKFKTNHNSDLTLIHLKVSDTGQHGATPIGPWGQYETVRQLGADRREFC